MFKIGELYKIKEMIFFFTILIIANSVSIYSEKLGVLLGVFEVALLIVLLIKKQIQNYILLFLVFCTVSTENITFFLGKKEMNMYNFLNLPKINGYHIYILLAIAVVYMLVYDKQQVLNSLYSRVDFFSKGIVLLFVGKIIMSFYVYLFDIDNITKSVAYETFFFRHMLRFLLVVGLGFVIWRGLYSFKEFAIKLESLLLALLLAQVIAAVLLVLCKVEAQYTSNVVLPITLNGFWCVLLMVFPLYSKYENMKVFIAFGVTYFALTMLYPNVFGGKWWLMVLAMIPLMIILLPLQNRRRKHILIFLGVLVLVLCLLFGKQLISKVNWFTLYKLKSALDLLFFWKEGWLENLGGSPKARIEEVLNIWQNISDNILLLCFGKGFGGAIKHEVVLTEWNQFGTYSLQEIRERLYFNMHDTIGNLFLQSGLAGILFLIKNLYTCIKNVYKNPWLVVGMVWLVFFVYSYTSLLFGMVALIFALYSIDVEEDKTRENGRNYV